MDEATEDINPAELVLPKEPLPVVYSSKIPPEFFDFIFIDECHRSIYNLWRQVLDYYDAFQIGLTATPDTRAIGYFNKNLVSEYSHETAVADGVNVGNEVYLIETKITKKGAQLKAKQLAGGGHGEPDEKQRQQAQEQLVSEAANVFTGPLIELIDKIRRDKEQTIDHVNLDTVENAGWNVDAIEHAQTMADEFAAYLNENKDTIEALKIFFSQPYRRRELTFDMIKQLFEAIRADRPKLAPLRVWDAYSRLDDYKGGQPISELSALVGLIRRVCGMDRTLTAFDDIVRRNFQNWIMKRHAGTTDKFSKEQMAWLQMIRDHFISSMHIGRDDLELAPFDGQGGLGKMYQLFGDGMDNLIDEMNEALAA